MNRRSVTASGQRSDIYYPVWCAYRECVSCTLKAAWAGRAAGDLCHAANVLSQRWSLLHPIPSQGGELPPKQIHTCALQAAHSRQHPALQ